jgi:hypothetical protein
MGGSWSDPTQRLCKQTDKVYYGRPLSTFSNEEEVEGLIISREGFRNLLVQEGDAIEFEYEIHAANLKVPHRGKLRLASTTSSSQQV